MNRYGINHYVVLIFIIFEVVQLFYFYNKAEPPKIEAPTPQPPVVPEVIIPKDELTLDKIFKRCLRSYNLAMRTRSDGDLQIDNEKKQEQVVVKIPETVAPIPEVVVDPYKFRQKVDCQEGYWDKKEKVCICDIGYMGEKCTIPITYCKADLERSKAFFIVYNTSYWGSLESRSGGGSTMFYTEKVREMIPKYIKKYNITSFFDSPCGDLNWMKAVEFPPGIEYVGVDVVREMVVGLRNKYKGNEQYNFVHRDTVMYPPFKSFDLIFSRDQLQHLSHAERIKIIQNWENSGSKYVLTTFYTDAWDNGDLDGYYSTRNINLMEHPYNFAEPLEQFIDRNPTDVAKAGEWVKNMGLWELPIKKRK
jgi:hypothetical protein